MNQIAYQHAVFLSPHHDDICFSVAGIALQQASGALVNLFTRSEHVDRPMTLPPKRNDRIAFITRLRAAEDVRFAEAVGLKRYDLALPEPSLRDFAPADSSNLSSEVDGVRSALFAFLEAHYTPGDGHRIGALMCPMGIGGHRDHLLTLLAVKEMIAHVLGRFDLFLYEDLHYAHERAVRQVGIERASTIMSELRLSRIRSAFSEKMFARKLALLAIYDSQFKTTIDPTHFIPADEDHPTPHEAVWRCSP